MAAERVRATIVDVGREAGVSTKTVSRVFNGEPHVTPAVRQRVHAAAKALNYHPNMMARALVRRRSHLIGLVYENPSPNYVVELQKGVLHRLRDERYRLVVIPITSLAERAAEVVALLRSAALDGVVLGPPACDDPRILADLAEAGIRYARIAPTSPDAGGSVTLVNDVTAACEAAEHLLALGHRELAIIKGDPTHAATERRLRGYADALDRAGVTVPPQRIEQGCFTRDSGYAAGRRLLAGADRPTAILAMNDDMAVGALVAARELGLAVPGDLSLVGFDDSEVAQVTWPRLTTVRQPVFDMAAAATDMVLAELEGVEPTARRDHPHALVVRESSGPPPAAGIALPEA